MTYTDFISILISLVALTISAVTAYKTLIAKFRVTVFLKPRVVLTRINGLPSIAVGCEFSNLGAKAGSIDDIVLIVKYRQQDGGSINTFSFLPLLMREDYSVFRSYQNTDFEPFQSIPIPAKVRLARYIVFRPSHNTFDPSEGDIELQLFRRNAGENKWQKAVGESRFSVNVEAAKNWKNPDGESFMIETSENDKHRKVLMENVFS